MKKILVFALLVVVIASQAFAAGKKQVKLRITEVSTAIFDETSVALDLGERQYVFPEDGQKVFDTSSSAPNIYSFSGDMVPCFSNSYGAFAPGTVVPLGIKAEGNGLYSIRATLLDNIDPTSIVRLEDRQQAVFHDLRDGDYLFLLNQFTQAENRFFLHISYPIVVTSMDAGCNNDDGVIAVTQDPSISWNTVKLLNDTGRLVYTNTNATGNFTFSTLPFGHYNLVYEYGNYTAGNEIYVNGWSINNEITASTIYAGVYQPIDFFSNSIHTGDYFWNFGDGSEIEGVANPDYAYTEPGTYEVTLVSSNSYGCSSTATITVYISEATGVEKINANDARINLQNRSLQILFNRQIESGYSVQLFNSMGQSLQHQPLSQTETNIDLGNMAAGVYIVRIANSNGGFTKKIILN